MSLFDPWIANGFASALLPVIHKDKRPAIKGWVGHTPLPGELEEWGRANCNVGLKTARFPVLDIDIEDPAVVARVVEIAQAHLGQTARRGRPNSGKVALVYRLDGGAVKPRTFEFAKTAPYDKREIAIDLLSSGNQVVVSGTHPSGVDYFWAPSIPFLSDLPLVTELDLMIALAEIEEYLVSIGYVRRVLSGALLQTSNTAKSALGVRASNPKLLEDALDHLPNPDLPYDQWVRVGIAVKSALGDTPEAFHAFERWSAKSSKDDPAITRDKWDSFAPRGDIGAGTIYAMARAAGWSSPEHVAALRGSPASEFSQTPSVGAPGAAPATPRHLPFVWNGAFAGPAPARKWVVDEWMPDLNVTSIYGFGGTGKSYLAQQLVTCVSTGRDWLGLKTDKRKCAVFSCEDDTAEYWLRQNGVDAMYGLTTPTTARDFMFFDRLGLETLLMLFNGDNAAGTLTETYEALRRTLIDYGAGLIVVDTAARTFGGNENARAQVQHFVQAGLVKLARDIGGACVLCAHPSKSVTSGGYSGSTAWPAAVRSMLTLGEYDPAMPDMRALKKAKANYSGKDELILKWAGGGFVVSASGGSGDKTGAEARFLAMLDEATARQVALSTKARAENYAPKWFRQNLSAMQDKYRIEDITAAMERLLARKVILADADLGWARGGRKKATGIARAQTKIEPVEDPF